MKAIYTTCGKKVYRVHQDTGVPTELCSNTAGIHATVSVDQASRTVRQNVYINTMDAEDRLYSNKEKYNQLVDLLKRELITETPLIQNFFKIYVDYSIFENGREVDQSALVRPMTADEAAVLLGVATNNETVYRRVKHFTPKIEFNMKNAIPYGIMASPSVNYVFRINGLSVFQETSNHPEYHQSTYCNPYSMHSQTISHGLEDMELVYSSDAEGIEFAPIEISFAPRKVQIAIDMVLANYVVCYDDSEIQEILDENMEKKYHPIPPVPPCPPYPHVPPCPPYPPVPPTPPYPPIPPHPPIPPFPPKPDDDKMFPEDDDKVPADGDYEPRDGYFDFYERARKGNPNALLVVEDAIPDSVYEPKKMIKKAMVIRDIPDVRVGEYVIYRQAWSVDIN